MNLFDRVANSLDGDYLTFWNELLSKYGAMRVRDSELFRFSLENKKSIASNNPYLESHRSYKVLKSKIGDINLNLENCDIFSLPSTLNKNYSLINVSNIIDYATVEQYLNLASRLPLAENGTILSYSFSPSTNFLFADRLCDEKFESNVIPVARKSREQVILTKHRNN